ncbi:CBS domain-containing protein [Streptomyces sp. WMMC940]|uniref:CBS domain-containing protein n=1 Tax=Streptomyces sp. WMMC940 TaxID=3015153 RepID=UPI0022B6CF31|nr:CBS domain-containing protein [Streptomyces sp. WMMC940]MCZ7458141.1 CBS domain-containing protein [Streptomyces sp. WMMC940]
MAADGPRIFLSHLAGVPVFGPDGGPVGRVRDLVATFRVDRPPRLVGLVVEVLGHGPVFVPVSRATGLESGQVTLSGPVSMRRFGLRPDERLVLGQLLDRRVRLADSGEQVTVLDVEVHRHPARAHWEVDRICAHRDRGGTARHRGEALTVDWSALSGLPPEELLVSSPVGERPNFGQDAEDEAEQERTARALMRTEPVVVPPEATVADALARLGERELIQALAAQVYVCRPPGEPPTGPYLGTVPVQRLLRSAPDAPVAPLVDTELPPLHPDTPLPAVSCCLTAYDLVAAPVVDDEGALLGAVTVDAVLDHLLPDHWREAEYGMPDADGTESGAAGTGVVGDPTQPPAAALFPSGHPGGRDEVDR